MSVIDYERDISNVDKISEVFQITLKVTYVKKA